MSHVEPKVLSQHRAMVATGISGSDSIRVFNASLFIDDHQGEARPYLAESQPQLNSEGWRVFLLILAAMVCGRTCAMAFNRIVDRKFDALNPRTAGRHLPTGQITLGSAWALCVLSAAGLVAITAA